MKRKPIHSLAIILVLAMILSQNKAHSMENVTVPTEKNEFISVELPVIEERDPFSFFIDPRHIFYNTFGNSGGDITVEEDTYLLFYNRDESEYTLSSRSDILKIINKSTVPVEVTITAKLENADGIFIMQDKEFQDRDSCDLYLALVDNEGNEQPLSEDGEMSITVKLDRAPLDTYAYVFCEDTGEYQYAYQSGDVTFDTYTFGLMGTCNEKGDWTSISGKPHVTISWNVEPIVSEGLQAGEELDDKLRNISSNSVSGDEVLDKDEQSARESSEDGEEGSAENAAVDTEDSESKDDVSDDKETMTDDDVDPDSSSVDKESEVLDKDEQSMGEASADSEEDLTENAVDGMGDSESKNDVLDDKETLTDGDLDSNGRDSDNEEELGKDSSKDESSMTEEVKGEPEASGEEQLQESKELDETSGSEDVSSGAAGTIRVAD